MPKRTDIHRILVIGSGPIIIGQGAEFDYSGTQAAKALREEGFEVILVNSNPATIMTDPEIADRTYIEPVTPEYVELVIAKERPDALLPTMGGQTALNVAMKLAENGVLQKYGVELIGADARAISMAEDRKLFGEAMRRIGLAVPQGDTATTLDEALEIVERTAFPAIIRPAFTLGGTGGGIAYNRQELEEIVRRGLDLSPVTQVLIERSVIGWKEFELEVMRDGADNVVIVCSIENIDPMGVHTGDSITVAPAMTLTDRRPSAAPTKARCERNAGRSAFGRRTRWSIPAPASFPSATPYLYSSYDEESEAPQSGKRSVIILGSGPNRIGQGVEFDYCCVRAALALREQGFETIMINSNPETVSTDFDISDKLYFEPLTLEDVLEIVEREQPVGRHRAARRADAAQAHAPARGGGRYAFSGTLPDSIDIAEDRRRFDKIARELGLQQPPNGTATSIEEAVSSPRRGSGIPCWCGRRTCWAAARWRSCTTSASLKEYFERAARVRGQARCSSIAFSRTRSRRTSTRSRTASAS